MVNPVHFFFSRTIKRSVMTSFVLVLLLPIGFFVFSLFENSWEQAQQNMLEKHGLIAESMVEPLSNFISSRQQSLQVLGDELSSIETESRISTVQKNRDIQLALNKYVDSYDDLSSIVFESKMGKNNYSQVAIKESYKIEKKAPDYNKYPLKKLPHKNTKDLSLDYISPVFESSISSEPVVLIKHNILNEKGKVHSALYIEVSLKNITDICSKISFGKLGHCAIVDQVGRVVAHPNKGWVKAIRDLSKLSVVKLMLAGKSGTTEFYSPFLKGDMVAGYSAIPDLGWGIMIPQPKAELTKTLNSLRKSTLIWMSLGIVTALLMALFLAHKITKPIQILTKRTHDVSAGYDFIKLGPLPENSPKEITQLSKSISRLLFGLQKSNKEVKRLNVSLNRDIEKATKELKDVNNDLYQMSNKDYLTSISNRRYFTAYLDKILKQKNKEYVGVILVDIDKFKFINDQYGHEVGDLAIIHISRILSKTIRKCDLVSRLGGDEFVIYIRNTSDDMIVKIAEKLRENAENSPLYVENKKIQLTLSIGTVNHLCDDELKLENYLNFADKALYTSKKEGRNKVSSYYFQPRKNS